MSGKTCETCRWWDGERVPDDDQASLGACHRHPPVLIQCVPTGRDGDADVGFAWEFPHVWFDAWCGEWKAK